MRKVLEKFHKFLDWLNDSKNDSLRHLLYFILVVALIGVIWGTIIPEPWRIDCIAKEHAKEGWFGLLYYIILYATILIYVLSAVYICTTGQTVESCVYVIFSSIVFIVFMDAYLTIITQFKTESETVDGFRLLYEMHLNCLIGVVTIICAIAGIKMTYIFKKTSKK